MAVEIAIRKLYDKLVPIDAAQMELFEELKMNGEYKAVLTQPRNYKFHCKFFSMIDLCYKSFEQPEVYFQDVRVFKSKQQFRDEIVIACGYWTLGLSKTNKPIREAKSISFAKMDQDDFEKLYSKAIDVILADYLPHYKKSDIDRLTRDVLNYA